MTHLSNEPGKRFYHIFTHDHVFTFVNIEYVRIRKTRVRLAAAASGPEPVVRSFHSTHKDFDDGRYIGMLILIFITSFYSLTSIFQEKRI